MKHFTVWAVVAVLTTGGLRAAEGDFSKTVRAEDFAAAGLGKLSATELARLDALVREFKTGGVSRPSADGAKKSGGAKEVQPDAGKAAVRVAPGTVVEVGEVESAIAGDFEGWAGRTVFLLENGQRWRVANGGSYYSPKLTRPKVKISPAGLGGYWMAIEGVGTRVKVLPLSGQ
jgi:hypothetical protein